MSAAGLSPGDRVGPFVVERSLGEGASGEVLSARDEASGAAVAIKVLRRALADDAEASARFEREARAAARLGHPGIVPVVSIGKLPDGRPYLVMERLSGRSLRGEIEARGALPAGEAWAVARALADALSAAHREGVVHRDVKPDNVFLERREGAAQTTPRLLDFGLARVEAKGDLARLTRTGTPLGTPAYMAPEQWWGERVGPEADQYGLGVTLFEMLTGRRPFDGAQMPELMQAHLNLPAPSLESAGVSLSPPAEALVARLLAKEPAARFASMDALIAEGDHVFGPPVPFPEEPAHPHSLPSPAPSPSPRSRLTPAIAGSLLPPPSPGSPLAPASPRSARARFLALHALVVGLGLSGLCAAGYAGPRLHDPRYWFVIAGHGAFPIVIWFAAGALLAPRSARLAAETGRLGTAAWAMPTLAALSGAFGTYTGWGAVLRALERAPLAERFALFNQGVYEANAARFLGLSLACLGALSAFAMLGLSSRVLPGADRRERRRSLAAAAACALSAVLLALAGSPQASLVAGAGFGLFALRAALPASSAGPSRTAAALAAASLAVGAGLTGLEGRESVLWSPEPFATRAERAAEIVRAAAERQATVAASAALIALVVALEASRLARRGPLASIWKHERRPLALLGLLVASLGADGAVHAWFLSRGEALRRELEPQFRLFASLVPPSEDALPAERFPPHAAPALQIARGDVAVDGRPVGRLSLLDSPDGLMLVRARLAEATSGLGRESEPGAPDLALAVDREVPWSRVAHLLELSYALGVRRVEVLLLRGPPPALPTGAPREASYVVSSDFVALPAQLSPEAPPLDPGAPFARIAPALAALASRGEPLSLSSRR